MYIHINKSNVLFFTKVKILKMGGMELVKIAFVRLAICTLEKYTYTLV